MPTVRRGPLTPFDGRYAEPIPETSGEIDKLWRMTWFERVQANAVEAWETTNLIAALSPHLLTITVGRLMKNWKTTVTGIVGGIAVLAQALFGVVIPQEAVIAVTIFVVSLFAGDANK